ncbi:hypothetical protein AMBLS11_08655 [Alteromonas macleodii str. 'Black Sea 11']|nr:hypothetical protein AMBLS11_08655 [Alteromonas macleodii str. 'Black Sea 11']
MNELLESKPKEKSSEEPQKPEVYSNEILEEILDLSRVNQKLLRNPDSDVHMDIDSIRMMLKEVLERSMFEKESRMMKRKRRVHPKMLDELLHMSPRFEKNFTGFQIAIGLFRSDFPWIYDAGIDLVRTLRSTRNPEERRDAVEAFQELIEFSFKHPLMRDMYMPDKEMWMMARELPHILRRTLDQHV